MFHPLFRHWTVRKRIRTIVAIAIAALVLGTLADMLAVRDTLLAEKEAKTREVVETAYGVLRHFHDQELQGRVSGVEARAAAVATLRDIRYDGREYFWLNDLGAPYPRMVMHPTMPQLDGTVLDSPRFDCTTRVRAGNDGPFEAARARSNLFSAFVDVVRRSGAGYVSYRWPKPLPGGGVTAEAYEKLSYVKGFTPWGWLVGSGIYVDDVDRAVRSRALSHLAGAAGLGLVLLLVSSAIAGSITRPLSATAEAMDAIGEDLANLAPRLPVVGDSEIDRVARGLNTLLDRIQKHEATLESYRQDLERRVAERTACLAQAKQGLERELAERREMQRQLSEHRARMQALLNASDETMLLLDTVGGILAINEAGARRFGKAPQEMQGRNFFDFLPPALAATRRQTVAQVLESGTPARSHDLRQDIHFENSVFPVMGETGTVTSLAVFAKDVTESLRASQTEAMFHQLDAMLLRWHMDTGSVAQIFCDEILSLFHLPAGWLGRREPDGRIAVIAASESMGEEFQQNITASRLRWDGESSQCAPAVQSLRSGHPVRLPLAGLPGPCGAPEGCASVLAQPLILRDETWGVLILFGRQEDRFLDGTLSMHVSAISRRLASTLETAEQQEWLSLLETALARVGQAILITGGGTEGRILWANPACEALTGQPPGVLHGRAWQSLQLPPREEAAPDSLPQALKSGRDWQGTRILAGPDGSGLAVKATVHPVGSGPGAEATHCVILLEPTAS